MENQTADRTGERLIFVWLRETRQLIPDRDGGDRFLALGIFDATLFTCFDTTFISSLSAFSTGKPV